MRWFRTIRALLNRPRPGTLTILAVMPHDSARDALQRIAVKSSWRIEFASTCQSALHLARHTQFHVILYDRDLGPSQSWRDALDAFALNVPASPVILTSRANDDRLWQEVVRRGGYDVLTKPFQETRVIRSVEFASACRKQNSG